MAYTFMTIRERQFHQAALLLEKQGAVGQHDEIVARLRSSLGADGTLSLEALRAFGLTPQAAARVSGYETGGDPAFTLDDADAWASCEGATDWLAFVDGKESAGTYAQALKVTMARGGFCLRRPQ